MPDDLADSVELLQALIRSSCVNDGTASSGQERRATDLLRSCLEGASSSIELFEKTPGRTSIVARIEGSDPTAPTLCLMGHTDVVPVNEAGWSRDPFGGELVDGEVWGRGAIDMLNMTATMAIAFRALARRGFRPRGTLIFFGVADEEAGGRHGARWMTEEHWDAIGCDYVLTELGGWRVPARGGRDVIQMNVAEKGPAARRLRVRGTPGHGSMPYGADNAVIVGAEIVRRLAEHASVPRIDELWRRYVDLLDLSDEVRDSLVDPDRLDAAIAAMPLADAKRCHAMTHTTFSPNVIAGGTKQNVIPDEVVIDVDVRVLPGTSTAEVDDELRAVLGDLAERVTVEPLGNDEGSASSTDNPLWDVLRRNVQVAYPGADLQPGLLVGSTDGRHFRRQGAVAIGTGLFSRDMTASAFSSRFHGNDERVDVASLALTLDLWKGVATDLLG